MLDSFKGPYFTEFFAILCATCITDAIIYPFTTARIRLQMVGPPGYTSRLSTMQLLTKVAAINGYRYLYSGMKISFLRLLVYNGLRMGMLYTCQEIMTTKIPLEPEVLKPTINLLAVIGIQPLVVAKVRYQAGVYDPKFPIHKAFKIELKEEGFIGLFRGLTPNIFRSLITHGSDTFIRKRIDNALEQGGFWPNPTEKFIIATAIHSFITVMLITPIDVTRNRYINEYDFEYKNVLHCLFKISRREGIRAFYRGASAYYYSTLITNLIMWFIYDRTKTLYQSKT